MTSSCTPVALLNCTYGLYARVIDLNTSYNTSYYSDVACQTLYKSTVHGTCAAVYLPIATSPALTLALSDQFQCASSVSATGALVLEILVPLAFWVAVGTIVFVVVCHIQRKNASGPPAVGSDSPVAESNVTPEGDDSGNVRRGRPRFETFGRGKRRGRPPRRSPWQLTRRGMSWSLRKAAEGMRPRCNLRRQRDGAGPPAASHVYVRVLFCLEVCTCCVLLTEPWIANVL